jgi:hypothetical protein
MLEARLLAAMEAISELRDEELQAPQRAFLHLSNSFGGFGLQQFDLDVADAAFLSAAAFADEAMTRGPDPFQPFSTATAVDLCAKSERLLKVYYQMWPSGTVPDVLQHSFPPQLQKLIARAHFHQAFNQVVAGHMHDAGNGHRRSAHKHTAILHVFVAMHEDQLQLGLVR